MSIQRESDRSSYSKSKNDEVVQSPEAQDAFEALTQIAQVPQSLSFLLDHLEMLGEQPGRLVVKKEIVPGRYFPGSTVEKYTTGFQARVPLEFELPFSLRRLNKVLQGKNTLSAELRISGDYKPYKRLKEGHKVATKYNIWGDVNIVRSRTGHAMPAFQDRSVEFTCAIVVLENGEERVYEFSLPFDSNTYIYSRIVLAEEEYDYQNARHHRVDYSDEQVQQGVQAWIHGFIDNWPAHKREFQERLHGERRESREKKR